jgi:hypothetical protein
VVTQVKGDGDIRDLLGECSFNHYRYPESSSMLYILMEEACFLGAFLTLGLRQMYKYGMDPAYYFGPDSPARPKNRRN